MDRDISDRDTANPREDLKRARREGKPQPGGHPAAAPSVIILGDGTKEARRSSHRPAEHEPSGGFSSDAPYGHSDGPIFNDLADGSEDPLAEPVDLRRNAPGRSTRKSHSSEDCTKKD